MISDCEKQLIWTLDTDIFIVLYPSLYRQYLDWGTFPWEKADSESVWFSFRSVMLSLCTLYSSLAANVEISLAPASA